jgi:hypothetical protein
MGGFSLISPVCVPAGVAAAITQAVTNPSAAVE